MALLATWAGLPALVRDPRRGRRLLRWLGLGRLPLARNILLPQPLTRAQSSSAVAPVGGGSGEGAEPNGIAAWRHCRLAMRWPDSPNDTVAW